MDETTTAMRAWSAEGARVALVTCLECGAAILIDPADDFDPTERHARWHAAPTEEPSSE